MNKMNKKGFTLIEMLVVIAIIAILVSIIIPTITGSTQKAAAAANAANLRSMKAELVTTMLTGGGSCRGFSVTGAGQISGSFDNSITFKEIAGQTSTAVDATYSGGDIVVKYGGKTIAEWAALAGS